ncbi:hypothetical protein SAMN05421740_108154 [Parapedobacter koreensis]|uniref:ParE toxin of type II toxin-antitoxin system, parDE n=1 Tax=Parapedobacter koreensis TaxID=332977 RepID=A0A1H7S8E2_9SPHI|nr:hypothetical protein SAMN05421740_108154 [Parapedobacter koreensis]
MKYIIRLKQKSHLSFYTLSLNINSGKPHADKFLQNAEKTIFLVGEQPYIFKKSEFGEQHIRLGLIARQTSFLYEITDDKIILHFFWDNRQEPFYEHNDH